MYNQLATFEEAKQISDQLGAIGGGVVDTYIPEYGGPFVQPSDGPSKFLHFKFANGADGFNVGLIRAFMQNSPLRWPVMIGTQVEAARRVPVSSVPVGDAKPGLIPVPTGYMPIDLSREVRPGVFASSAGDIEPIGALVVLNGVEYVKVELPNGMTLLRAWQKK
jgi:hypothetical protein